MNIQNYLLNIGLHDRLEHRQVIASDRARDIVKALCNEYAGGCTLHPYIYEGVWEGESEPSIAVNVIANLSQIEGLCKRLCVDLNQNAIAVTELGRSLFIERA